MIWPPSNELGLLKGEIFCIVSRPPEQLTPEETEELERRAYAILNKMGSEGRAPTTKEPGIVYQTMQLIISSSDNRLEVRHAGPPSKHGVHCFQLAYQKRKTDNVVLTYVEKGRLALTAMRKLMILDDLADA
jgi:hypothetical protein